jgi:hypothetical protein
MQMKKSARDLYEGLRSYRVNDHAYPEYKRENNSNSACRESYDDDHCQPSETCSPMALLPKFNRPKRILETGHRITLIAGACA